MTAYMKMLNELSEDALPEAGGKGASLGTLIRAGLPVPPGFVVTTRAYRAHLEASGLTRRIQEALAQLRQPDIDAIAAASREISGWIEEAAMPRDVQAELEQMYGELAHAAGGNEGLSVAVRSSATAEDLPTASFAGQHETYLGVYGKEAVSAHVKKCWASLWTPQAITYRMNMNFDHLEVALAVVIQAMIPAEAAGVMFTANPVSGKRDEILISAGYGLGEAVVSGLITPDTFIVTKDGRVQERTLGSKKLRIQLKSDGTVTEEVPLTERQSYCLGPTELTRLSGLAKLVEQHYGCPIDTEWALSQGNIYLLQARPITAMTPTAVELEVLGPEDEIIYKGAKEPFGLQSVIEHSPYPHAPLDFASFCYFYKGVHQNFMESGFSSKGDDRPVERENGVVALHFAGLSVSPAMLWKLPAAWVKNSFFKNKYTWYDFASEVQAWIEKTDGVLNHAGDARQMVDLFEQALKDYQHFVYKRFAVIAMPSSYSEKKIASMVKQAAGQANADDITASLLRALPFRTALQNQALLKMAQAARLHGKDSQAYHKELKQFLREYGDRPSLGMGRMLSPATWREEPEKMDEVIEALLADSSAPDPEESFRRQEAEFNAAKQLVRDGLKPAAYAKFLKLLDSVREATVIREESVFYLEKLAGCLHRIALKLGEMLAERKVIDKANDIFFLLLEELRDAAQGKLEVRERIGRRKGAFARVCAAHEQGVHWLISTGSFPVFSKKKRQDDDAANAGVIRGSAASRGMYEGPVCIVKNPAQFKKLKKGDVLVSPYTAPLWTPLFKIAGAAVTEIGSAGSHAAIVAREYGIPAVVAIDNATNLLQDGQRIRVDGTKGIVTLLD
ncbi:PEP-utilizing enzyme [Paenibacillus doosanensis]|uniref:PEP/pyruvate-binding domain-containing protein n=1 Tax=Paenibacillus doosanensis TaxID=1229154 RepID=UPI0021803E95|nr:PEP/pyruvate-binding domain-containing protein [Paenibacillus doosanensis]MCS7462783.1 PEP-utilizing enzyme [Paenibacillus doosanensis]